MKFLLAIALLLGTGVSYACKIGGPEDQLGRTELKSCFIDPGESLFNFATWPQRVKIAMLGTKVVVFAQEQDNGQLCVYKKTATAVGYLSRELVTSHSVAADDLYQALRDKLGNDGASQEQYVKFEQFLAGEAELSYRSLPEAYVTFAWVGYNMFMKRTDYRVVHNVEQIAKEVQSEGAVLCSSEPIAD